MPSSDTPSPSDSAKSLNLAAHAAFVPIGIVTVLLGPMLPSLSARWGLNYEQAGSLFTAQFLGSTLGVALSGILASRWGFRFAISAGLLATAAGLFALPFSSGQLGTICIACYGVGIGVAIPAANLLVAELNPERRSAALNRLNFSWSVGAVACPFLVAAAVKAHQLPLFLIGLAGSILIVMAGIAAMYTRVIDPVAKGDANRPDSSPIDWQKSSLASLGVLFFLYIGAENAFGGWIASYSRSLSTPPPALSVMTPSFFYASLLAGRWAAGSILKKTDEVKLVRAALLMACVGMAGLIFSRTMPSVVASTLLAGIGLAAVYPVTISLLSREFGRAAARVGSVMFAMANLGGASIPWLVGYCSHRFNDLRAGLAVPLLAAVLMTFLYWLKLTPSPRPGPAV
jgi:fucose permease